MVESVDTRDLKSLAVRGVPVQVWLGAPFMTHCDVTEDVTEKVTKFLKMSQNRSQTAIFRL